ncbi:MULTISPECIES: hypothetical protein [Paraburkholderia]|uniref:hypothetical protein n=1 Tax=Paraburkholderia TaxID=1822464 RepID=UPI0014289E9D|nr:MULTISPECIES: hypothetical protein [Paraburkholderia]
MPVDFSKLPPKQPVPDNPPSRWLWTVVFFVIVIAGIFAVLQTPPQVRRILYPAVVNWN